jgi:hypothetical protein
MIQHPNKKEQAPTFSSTIPKISLPKGGGAIRGGLGKYMLDFNQLPLFLRFNERQLDIL